MDFESMGRLPTNVIVCSYKNAAKLAKRFPRKQLLADRYCPDRIFYYVNRRGEVRHYEAATGKLVDLCTGRWATVYAATPYGVKPLE